MRFNEIWEWANSSPTRKLILLVVGFWVISFIATAPLVLFLRHQRMQVEEHSRDRLSPIVEPQTNNSLAQPVQPPISSTSIKPPSHHWWRGVSDKGAEIVFSLPPNEDSTPEVFLTVPIMPKSNGTDSSDQPKPASAFHNPFDRPKPTSITYFLSQPHYTKWTNQGFEATRFQYLKWTRSDRIRLVPVDSEDTPKSTENYRVEVSTERPLTCTISILIDKWHSVELAVSPWNASDEEADRWVKAARARFKGIAEAD